MKSNAKIAIGLDVRETCLSMVSVKRTLTGIRVVDATKVAIDPGTIQDGRIVDSVKLVKALKTLKKGHRVRSRQVALSLPAECTITRVVTLREEDPQRIAQFVQDEVRQYATLSGRETISDFRVLTPARVGGAGKALVVGADHGTADALNCACRRAGLRVGAIEPPVTACVRLLDVVKVSGVSEFRLLLAICREDVLTLCVFRRGVLDLVRTKDIGSPSASCECVGDEINATIQFYDTEGAGTSQPWHVVIIDENTEAISDDLLESARARLLAEKVDIWTKGTLPPNVAVDPQAPNTPSITALGLATRSLLTGEHDPQVNLVPWDATQGDSSGRTVLLTASAMATLMLLVILLVGGLQIMVQRTIRTTAAIKRAELQRGELSLIAAISEREYIEQRSQVLAAELDSLHNISESRRDVNWVQLLSDIKTATPEVVRITDLSVDAKSDMVMEGISRSYEAVHVFVGMLNRSKHVQQALLLEAHRAEAQEGFVEYAIKCSLQSREMQ